MTTTQKYLFCAIIFGILAIISLVVGCKNDSGGKIEPQVGDKKLLGVWTKPDSSKQLDIFLLRIVKTVKYDSVKKKDVIIIDSIVGRPIIIKAFDSAGNILKNKDGKDSINPNPQYIQVGRDSISFRVENISVDSLLKKK